MTLHRIFGLAAAWMPAVFLSLVLAPRAYAQGTTAIVAGHARFEFLTPSLVRMEYSPSAAFVDTPTAVVQKRDWPAVHIQSRHQDGWLVASSDAVTLRYRLMAQSGYPWTLDLRTVYDLSADGLTVTQGATNPATGPTSGPAPAMAAKWCPNNTRRSVGT